MEPELQAMEVKAFRSPQAC